jgi:hypothetical protein
LRVRHSRSYTVKAGPGWIAALLDSAYPGHGPAGAAACDRPGDLAVDHAVDSAVDSDLSRGITRAFLWISWIIQKILR